MSRADIWMNGGYFVFHNDIFKYIKKGEELVEEPFQRLIEEKQLSPTSTRRGFWACMDTFKDTAAIGTICISRGEAPWEVWKPALNNQVELMHA